MAFSCDPAAVARARVLIEGSARTLEDIAVEIGVSVQSLRNWIRKHGWRRHPLAPRAVPKLPPEKEAAARRLYEGGAAASDLARLIACHESYVHRLAKQRGWRRPGAAVAPAEEEARPPGPLAAEIAAVAAQLRDPDLTRAEIARLIEHGYVLTLVEGIGDPSVGIERRLALAQMLAEFATGLPDDPPPAPPPLSPEEEERERQARLEALMRRVSSWGEAPDAAP